MSNFIETLNNTVSTYYGTDDALCKNFDLKSDSDFAMIVVSPVWNPTDVFKDTELVITCVKNRNTSGSYIIEKDGKKIAWIRSGAGAGNVVDTCLSLVKTKCDKILFLGTSTALKPDLKIGDLVVPNKAISGTGATRYLLEDMDGDPTFLTERRTPPKGILWLSKAAIKATANLHTRTVFSTDSLVGALLHRDMIMETGADVIDMEATAFARCMTLMERTGAVLLTIVGNASDGTAMVRIQPDDNADLDNTQNVVIPEIICNMV